MTSQKITAIVLAKNEEDMIGDCLESLGFVDEIIVVDNNSTDATAAIARKKGARIITTASTDFSQLRELGLKKVTTGYVLYLDADERVTPALQDEIQKAVFSDSPISAYRIPRQNFYLGKHPWPVIEHHLRFFRRDGLKGWEGELHETAKIQGDTADFVSPMLHFTHRDFTSMVEKTNTWSEKEAELRLKAHHPKITWWRFPRVMFSAFYHSYITEKGWKVGTAGLLESMFQAFSIFITYAKLWELQQKKHRE